MDRAVLIALRRPSDLGVPIGPALALDAMRDVTSLASTTVTLLVMAIGATAAFLCRRRIVAATFLLAIGGGSAVVNLIKLAVGRARPDVVPHLTREVTDSFPSSHAALAVLTYGTLAVIAARALPRLRVFAPATSVALVLAIAFSRLYLGVHYPTDVLAGLAFGLLWLILCHALQQAWASPD